jgi:hypothetical protein
VPGVSGAVVTTVPSEGVLFGITVELGGVTVYVAPKVNVVPIPPVEVTVKVEPGHIDELEAVKVGVKVNKPIVTFAVPLQPALSAEMV